MGTRRSGREDFGYTFVATEDQDDAAGGPEQAEEEEGGAAAAAPDVEEGVGSGPKRGALVDDEDKKSMPPSKGGSGSAEDPKEEEEEKKRPYVYVPPERSSGGGGLPNLPPDDDGGGTGMDVLPAALGSLGACCCCVTSVLVVVGGILLAVNAAAGGGDGSSSSSEAMVLAGTIVLILAAAAFLLGICACCFGCMASCESLAGAGGGGGHEQWEDAKPHADVKVQFRRLNDRYRRAEDALDGVHLDAIGGVKEAKDARKKEAKVQKDEEKTKRDELEAQVHADLEAGVSVRNIRRNYRPIAFLVRFEGDMMLSDMELLRKQVSIIVNCGRAGVDQAVVVVTSPGGAVSPYGLAASQLIRIRKAGIRLVVCVDTVAASGGYMMASVGDTICAAPFAIIGSIGVVTQIPNFHRFLDKNDIDAYLFTAGKHKRTVDVIGEVTEEGKAKLQEELDDMHTAFKDHIVLARPRLSDTIEDIATGEYWLAVHAKEKGLVDEIMTSDEYLESLCRENEIIEIVEKRRKTVWSGFHTGIRAVKAAVDGMSVRHHQGPTPMAVA